MYDVVGKSVGSGILFILLFAFVKAIESVSRSYPENTVSRFVYGVDGFRLYRKVVRQYGTG